LGQELRIWFPANSASFPFVALRVPAREEALPVNASAFFSSNRSEADL
jgi:hypothetical protein